MNKENRLYFPLFMDLNDKKAVIIGAGEIASRRISTLLDFCGDITVVAPQVRPVIEEMAVLGKIKLIRRAYESEDIKGAFMVIAAADSKVNDRVYHDCKKAGIYINHASDQSKCDFFFPAVVREGTMVAGISSSGADHEGVRRMREAIQDVLDLK